MGGYIGATEAAVSKVQVLRHLKQARQSNRERGDLESAEVLAQSKLDSP